MIWLAIWVTGMVILSAWCVRIHGAKDFVTNPDMFWVIPSWPLWIMGIIALTILEKD